MNKVLLALLIALPLSASAAEHIIHEQAYEGLPPRVSARFDMKAQRGRAWISVFTSQEKVLKGKYTYHSKKVYVPGLYFNGTNILYEKDGLLHTCAEAYETKWPFRYHELSTTGECRFITRTYTARTRTGGETKRIKMIKLILKTP